MNNKNTVIAEKIMAQATEYVDNPTKGIADGYIARRKYQRAKGIEGAGELFQINSDLKSWVLGIAEKDLPPGTWFLSVGMGDDVSLEITELRLK